MRFRSDAFDADVDAECDCFRCVEIMLCPVVQSSVAKGGLGRFQCGGCGHMWWGWGSGGSVQIKSGSVVIHASLILLLCLVESMKYQVAEKEKI